MSKRKIIEQDSINIDITTWPIVHVDNLSSKNQEIYLRRKKAVDLYLSNKVTLQQIFELTGIESNELRRHIRRCLQYDEEGIIYGYRALIPYKRIKEYERLLPVDNAQETSKETIKLTGAFGQLLNSHPSIKEKIDNLHLKRLKRTINEPRMRAKDIHKRFLKACKEEGIKDDEYPFNTKTLGKRSLERYLKQLEDSNFGEAAAKRYGKEAGRRARNSKTSSPDKSFVTRPYEQVQFDGHRIDAVFTITFTTPSGYEFTETIDRPWLLIIMDVATRVILGYHLCLNREYSSSDVLHCIRNAVVPWKSREFQIHGLRYPKDVGFVSAVIPETCWARWDELLYDNAKANLSDIVKNCLTRVVKCDVNAGPVDLPERRNLIERLFGLLEENGYHRLPNTTGSNPKDVRRQNPEKQAKQYYISVEHLEELTEILIANYNVTSHSGVDYLSPLQAMKQKISKGEVINQIPVEERSDVAFLTLQTTRNVVGSIKNGKRPHIQYEGVTYHNEILSRSPNLIGEKLTILVNIDDLRFLRAFLPDGSELGILTAHGKWKLRPHSLKMRKEINKLKAKKEIHYTIMDDPIEIFFRYLESEGHKKNITKIGKYQYQEKKKAKAEPKTEIHSMEKSSKENQASSHNDSKHVSKEKSKPRKLRTTLVY